MDGRKLESWKAGKLESWKEDPPHFKITKKSVLDETQNMVYLHENCLYHFRPYNNKNSTIRRTKLLQLLLIQNLYSYILVQRHTHKHTNIHTYIYIYTHTHTHAYAN